MTLSYNELESLSVKLAKSVASTLGLEEKERVFVGNEEKLFLLAVFQNMPDSNHQTSVKIVNYKNRTLFRMMDIWNDEILRRKKNKNSNQQFSQNVRQILIEFRGLLIKLKHKLLLNYKLKNANEIIHYCAHLRYGSFVIPNLSDMYFKETIEKNEELRQIFQSKLIENEIDLNLVEYLTHLFPTSHLEQYSKFSSHKLLDSIKVDKVATSIYGVMEDPLLSFLIKKHNSELIYVQHGGGPGFNSEHLAFIIEESGADCMYFWGTGENNVYPTRYRDKFFPKLSSKVVLALSDKVDAKGIKKYLDISENIFKNFNKLCVIAAHPNGQKFNNSNVQYGIGYRQHEKAQLVIYDNLSHSLLYQRILTKRPFLIIDKNNYKPQSKNAIKFISLLRDAQILVQIEELEKNVEYWAKLSPNQAKFKFNEIASVFFKHVLEQPKLEKIIHL
jgi:hypothetical protein